MDRNVAYILTEEDATRYRKDYEFRLEKDHERHQKLEAFTNNLKIFEQEVEEILGLDKVQNRKESLNNDEYVSEVENETELLKLERSFQRINKFARRDIEGDQTQHERREKRMLERAVLRKATQTTHAF